MHIYPSLNSTARLTCAISRPLNCGLQLKIGSQKLKKGPNVKILGVIIDDELNWEAHIKHLEIKLKAAIVLIKRIKQFIPKTEFVNIYNSLFRSHLTYCISAWGGVSKYKFQKISLSRRDAFVYFLKKCVIMIILSFTRPVPS